MNVRQSTDARVCVVSGVEEGRRYIERTVSKHSEMVASIRELSDGLMALEAKLKVTTLSTHHGDGQVKTFTTNIVNNYTDYKLSHVF